MARRADCSSRHAWRGVRTIEREPFLESRALVKHFDGVNALNDVSIVIKLGEVHAVVGENGAGKSTLMKILAGVHQADAGTIVVNGGHVVFRSPQEAQHYGIVLIHQELHIVPFFNAVENMFLGAELVKGPFARLNWPAMNQQTAGILQDLGIEMDLKRPTKRLSTAYQQLVMIGKALLQNASLIIMDEPTARLTHREIEALFSIIRKLRSSGLAIIYISHRLEEVFQIADKVTVMRDGQLITTNSIAEVDQDALIRLMVGREVKVKYPKVKVDFGQEVLSVKNLQRGRYVRNISFTARSGEILGVFGLVGSGRTELLRTIYGADKKEAGQVFLNGTSISLKSAAEGIKHGIAFIPEDRQGQGLVMSMAIRENSTLAALAEYCKAGFIIRNKEIQAAKNILARLRVKMRSIEDAVKRLSGGNQQKIVLSKWLLGNPKVILLDEPTRGIDVGSKAEIFVLIGEMAKEGVAIVLVSSELPEIMGVADRVLVLCEGKQMTILDRDELSAEKIMFYATGGREI